MAEEEFDATCFQTGKHLEKYFDNDGQSKRRLITLTWR
jgi:hypothetical protein